MAKRIVIGDLVVRVGVDSKKTQQQLKNLGKGLTRVGKQSNATEKKGLKLQKGRVETAKAALVANKAYSRLMKRDHAFAKKAEKNLLRAAKSNDKVSVARWKERIKARDSFFTKGDRKAAKQAAQVAANTKKEAIATTRARAATAKQSVAAANRVTRNKELANSRALKKSNKRHAQAYIEDGKRSRKLTSDKIKADERASAVQRRTAQANATKQAKSDQKLATDKAKAAKVAEKAKIASDKKATRREVRAYQEDRKRTRDKEALRQRNAQRAERAAIKAQERTQRRASQARATRSSNRTAMAQQAGSFANNLMFGAGAGMLGIGGVATAATIASSKNLLQYRVGANLMGAAYADRGVSATDADAKRVKLNKVSSYYNLDPAMIFQNIGQGMMNLPNMKAQTVEDMMVGMGVLGKSMGVSDVNLGRSLVGLQQFTVAQTAENLNQMTEAMPVLMADVAKGLGVTVEELKKAKQSGTLQDLVEKAGGMEEFIEFFNEAIFQRGTKLFEQLKGTYPYWAQRAAAKTKASTVMFAGGSEEGQMKFLAAYVKLLDDNQDTLRVGGEMIGLSLTALVEAVELAMLTIQPYIDEWVADWDKLSDEQQLEKVKVFFEELGSLLEYLAIFYAGGKMLGLFLGLRRMIKESIALTTLVNAASTGGVIGGVGGKTPVKGTVGTARVLALLTGAGGVAVSGAAGYAIGTLLYDNFISGTDFGHQLGKGINRLVVFITEDIGKGLSMLVDVFRDTAEGIFGKKTVDELTSKAKPLTIKKHTRNLAGNRVAEHGRFYEHLFWNRELPMFKGKLLPNAFADTPNNLFGTQGQFETQRKLAGNDRYSMNIPPTVNVENNITLNEYGEVVLSSVIVSNL